jgi:hypothetical protein
MGISILLHQAAVLRVAMVGRYRWFNRPQVAGFRELEFREQEGAFLLTRSLLQILAFGGAVEPTDNCT